MELLFQQNGTSLGMTGRVVELLASWRGIKGTPQIATVWKMAPICIFWCIWRKRNDRFFEDHECSSKEFRSFFLEDFIYVGHCFRAKWSQLP